MIYQKKETKTKKKKWISKIRKGNERVMNNKKRKWKQWIKGRMIEKKRIEKGKIWRRNLWAKKERKKERKMKWEKKESYQQMKKERNTLERMKICNKWRKR